MTIKKIEEENRIKNLNKYYEVYYDAVSGPMDSIVEHRLIGIYEDIDEAYKEASKHFPYCSMLEVIPSLNKKRPLSSNPIDRVFKRLRVDLREELGGNVLDDMDWLEEFLNELDNSDYNEIRIIIEDMEYISAECFRKLMLYELFNNKDYVSAIYPSIKESHQVNEMYKYTKLKLKIEDGIDFFDIHQKIYEEYQAKKRGECYA